MAILHPATLTPTKQEVLDRLFEVPVGILGTYRFDDPDGEVGVEGFVLSVEGVLRHVVLTYRDAELDGADEHLIGTMEHSALGTRWVYDGLGDPVALACFQRALLGEQEQAALEVHHDDGRVEAREPTARIVRIGDGLADGLVIAGYLPLGIDEGPRLQVTWDGGESVVAALA